jgi:protein-ribulosamine 3-kinase
MDFDDLQLEQIQFFESVLFASFGFELKIESYRFLGGGNINNAVRLDTHQGTFFLKWNEQQPEDFFECEGRGLELLREACMLRVPELLGQGRQWQKSYLLLEYLPPSEPGTLFWERLGQSLADLHALEAHRFGLDHDNYIGSLAQPNGWYEDGITFLIEKRFRPQAGLAYYNGLLPAPMLDKLEKLCKKLPQLIPRQLPSLLHGDLWSANVMTTGKDEPVLIDPAVYYGYREAELAFTKLFGGFEEVFYEAYQEAYPLLPGFEERIGLYNLYPLLVHLNLFGSGYLSGVERVLRHYA